MFKNKINKIVVVIAMFFLATNATAQKATDSVILGKVTFVKDARIDQLGLKLVAYNEASHVVKYANGNVATKGYRLMVLNTSDNALAMKVRGQLFQLYPDVKQYLSFQMPNVKMKFGNFLDRASADKMRKQLMAMKLVPNNIYILPETIEVKASQLEDKED